jgi:hypothetical protein
VTPSFGRVNIEIINGEENKVKKFFKIVGSIIGGIIVLGIIMGIIGSNSSSQPSPQSTTPMKQATTGNQQTTKPKSKSKPKPASAAPVTAPKSLDDELADMLAHAPVPTVKDDGFTKTATYILTNTTKDKFDYIELDYDVFNKSAIKTGSNMVNITNVTPGQKFQLQVTLLSSDGETDWKATGIYSSALHD